HDLPRLAPGLHREGRGPDRGASRRKDRGAGNPRRARPPRRLLRGPPPPAAPRGGDGEDRLSAAPDDDPIAPQTYDWKLFVRLLGYLRPYKKEVAGAFLLIVAMAGLDLVGPYLTKVAIDRYIAKGDARGLAGVAALFFASLLGAFFVRFLQTVLMQMTG